MIKLNTNDKYKDVDLNSIDILNDEQETFMARNIVC